MPDSVSKRAERSGRRSRSVMVTSQHVARDHELLDLRGALVELRDLRVAEGTLHLVLLDEAIAAAILNPWPSSPRRFAAGTRQPSKTSSAVSDARIPSLSSVLVTVNPGVPFSTTKAEMPRCPWARSVWQKTSANDASRPVVMKRLQPSIT